MKKFNLPSCPYCGTQISRLTAWAVQRKGDYRCDACGGTSQVFFEKKSYVFSWICELTALLLMLLVLFLQKSVSLFGVILVAAPFLVFYCFVPYQMRLLVIRKSPRERPQPEHPLSPILSPDDTQVIHRPGRAAPRRNSQLDDEHFDAAMREILKRQGAFNGDEPED